MHDKGSNHSGNRSHGRIIANNNGGIAARNVIIDQKHLIFQRKQIGDPAVISFLIAVISGTDRNDLYAFFQGCFRNCHRCGIFSGCGKDDQYITCRDPGTFDNIFSEFFIMFGGTGKESGGCCDAHSGAPERTPERWGSGAIKYIFRQNCGVCATENINHFSGGVCLGDQICRTIQ